MQNNTEQSAALILDIVDSIRTTRKNNCDKWRAERNEIIHSDWTDALMEITVEEDVKEVTEIIEWSKNSGRMIESLEDFKAYTLWEAYFDLHKDVHGVKARHTHWFDHDSNGWRKAIDSLTA